MPRIRQVLNLAFIVVVISALGAGVLEFASRPQFPFIERFKGAKRISEWTPGHSVDCYSFEEPYKDVLARAREELIDAGWKVVYEDPLLAEFKKQSKTAVLAAYARGWEKSEQPYVRCMAWIPIERGGLEERIGPYFHALANKGRLEDGLATSATPLPATGFSCAIGIDGTPGHPSVIWRNRGPGAITVLPKMFDLNDYEPRSPALPAKLTVPGNSYRSQEFVYPSPATDSPLLKYNINYEFGPSGDFEEWDEVIEYETQAEPFVNAVLEKGLHVFTVGNQMERPMEIRDLELSDSGRTLKALKGISLIRGKTDLTFRQRLRPDASPRLKFEYRLVPNKRWRVLDLDEG